MNEIIKKNGVKFGVITGLVPLLITLLIYVIDLKLFISPLFKRAFAFTILFFIDKLFFLLKNTLSFE